MKSQILIQMNVSNLWCKMIWYNGSSVGILSDWWLGFVGGQVCLWGGGARPQTFLCRLHHHESWLRRKNWTSWQPQGKILPINRRVTNSVVNKVYVVSIIFVDINFHGFHQAGYFIAMWICGQWFSQTNYQHIFHFWLILCFWNC